MIRISVVIPTYNRKDLLLETLQSLRTQSLPSSSFEVIVVNDGSNDGTDEMLRYFTGKAPFKLSTITQQNRGPAAARNAGIRLAKGEIVAFTDDDCLPLTDWLAEIDRAFATRSIVGLQGSTFTDGKSITPLTHQIDNVSGNHSVPTCNAAYLREVLIKAGGFDEEFPFPHNEDADLAWRVEAIGVIGFEKNMRVYHPPRTDKFSKVSRRMRILESEFRLYYKNPKSYKEKRSASPWKNIYYEMGIKTQGYYLLSRLKYLHEPRLALAGIALTLRWWCDLVWLLPAFAKANQVNKYLFARGDV